MNVYQLRDNLKNTIKNKRELLVDISDDLVTQFLNINIDELERILEECMTRAIQHNFNRLAFARMRKEKISCTLLRREN